VLRLRRRPSYSAASRVSTEAPIVTVEYLKKMFGNSVGGKRGVKGGKSRKGASSRSRDAEGAQKKLAPGSHGKVGSGKSGRAIKSGSRRQVHMAIVSVTCVHFSCCVTTRLAGQGIKERRC
jgi:hypothetical protein